MIATLESVSPYQQGKHYELPMLPKEGKSAFEERTWRERCHANEDGQLYIPPMAFKKALESTAKYLGKQIPGKGKSTYTKHFRCGLMIVDPVMLPVNKKDVKGTPVFVPSNGEAGNGKKVTKYFPTIPHWKADVVIHILDETITPDVLREHLEEAGRYQGIGVWRPGSAGGLNGRWKVCDLKDAAK